MPLRNCADCGQPVSDIATTCPHCGRPRVKRGSAAFKTLQLIVGLVFIISLIGTFVFDSTDPMFWLCVKACVPTGLFSVVALGVTWLRKT